MLKKEQIEILMRLHELEQSLASMYALFNEKFPAHRDLWTFLVKEENEHADAVRELYRRTYKRTAFFSEGSLRLAAIESIIEYIDKTCEMARLDQLGLQQVLELSCDIEKTMVAKDIFKHFKVDVGFTETLWKLRDGSEKHALLVQNVIDRLGKASHTAGHR